TAVTTLLDAGPARRTAERSAARTPHEVRGVLAAAIGADRFERYFGSDLDAAALDRHTVALRVPSAFIAESLRRRFGDQLDSAARAALGDEASIRFEVDPCAIDAASANERAVVAASQAASAPQAPAHHAVAPVRHAGHGATWRRLEIGRAHV